MAVAALDPDALTPRDALEGVTQGGQVQTRDDTGEPAGVVVRGQGGVDAKEVGMAVVPRRGEETDGARGRVATRLGRH